MNAWSSGTGMAGLFGAVLYLALCESRHAIIISVIIIVADPVTHSCGIGRVCFDKREKGGLLHFD